MKKLLFILLACISFGASAQIYQHNYAYGYEYHQRLKADSAIGFLNNDTLFHPSTPLDTGYIWFAGRPSDSSLWYWFKGRYHKLGTGTGSGGATTPGGSNTHIQFNNAGSFGGSANLTYDPSTNTFTLNGQHVITQSAPASVSTTLGTTPADVSDITGAPGGATSYSGSNATGGIGATIQHTGGMGGAITGTPTTGTGGKGGDIFHVGGQGGAGTTFGGGGGNVKLHGGTGGSGTTPGIPGYVAINGGDAFPGGNSNGAGSYIVGGFGNGTGLPGNVYLGVGPPSDIRGNVIIGNSLDDGTGAKFQVGGWARYSADYSSSIDADSNAIPSLAIVGRMQNVPDTVNSHIAGSGVPTVYKVDSVTLAYKAISNSIPAVQWTSNNDSSLQLKVISVFDTTVTANYSANANYDQTRLMVNATTATISMLDPAGAGMNGKDYYIRPFTTGQTITVNAAGTSPIELDFGTYASTLTISGKPLYHIHVSGGKYILSY